MAHASRKVAVQALPQEMSWTDAIAEAAKVGSVAQLPTVLGRRLTCMQKRDVRCLERPCGWKVAVRQVQLAIRPHGKSQLRVAAGERVGVLLVGPARRLATSMSPRVFRFSSLEARKPPASDRRIIKGVSILKVVLLEVTPHVGNLLRSQSEDRIRL